MKTVLISGAAGFLGSHLCDKFIDKGFNVIAIDNLITGDLDNIAHLEQLKNFQFINHDITKPFYTKENIDFLLHFASPASPIDYLKIPIQTLKVGSQGTHNMLGLAKKKKARILVASTSEIYGDPIMHPQSESYFGNVNTIGTRGVYDEAKRFLESITMAYNRTHNLDTRIVRIFNTYGPRMRLNDGRVIPAFIGQCLREESITVFGDGSQTRSFCYVDDLIDGIYKLLFSEYHLPVNLGNPDEISILKFTKEIKNLTNSNSKIMFKELPENDPLKRRPDISLAQTILNWSPSVSRKDGLRKTIKYFKCLPKEKLYEKNHKSFKDFNK